MLLLFVLLLLSKSVYSCKSLYGLGTIGRGLLEGTGSPRLRSGFKFNSNIFLCHVPHPARGCSPANRIKGEWPSLATTPGWIGTASVNDGAGNNRARDFAYVCFGNQK